MEKEIQGDRSGHIDSDLSVPLEGPSAIVPAGLVNSRVNQLDASADNSGESMIETLKKQKRGSIHNA